jgi:outer membrane protein OmpA-like peptidoglycan-associated protein
VTVAGMIPAPVMMAHSDSVSAEETRRLRERDAALYALRDSLSRRPVALTPAAVSTMEARIHFAFDKSIITDSAKAILDDKVAVFRANPTMAIAIVGYTDVTGTDKYNMALGTRRAQATKDYLVSQGIDASRIIVGSEGERQQITNSAGVQGEARNRRAIFQLVIERDTPKN